MIIYIGADHNGFHLKGVLKEYLERNGYEIVDEGDEKLDPIDDYPQFASKVVMAVRTSNDADPRGLLICGSGQGMCIAANRFKGIRASLCYDIESAHSSRNDDDANVLCLSARTIEEGKAEAIALEWLKTGFAGAVRFKRRIDELDKLV